MFVSSHDSNLEKVRPDSSASAGYNIPRWQNKYPEKSRREWDKKKRDDNDKDKEESKTNVVGLHA
jgi:hypothetical protein